MSFILIPSNFHRGRFKLYRLISRIVSAWTRIYKWLCWLKFFCWEPNCWVFIFLLLIKICKVFKNTFFLIFWRQWIDCNPYWLLLYDFIFNFIKSRSRHFINFCLYKLFLLCEYCSFGVSEEIFLDLVVSRTRVFISKLLVRHLESVFDYYAWKWSVFIWVGEEHFTFSFTYILQSLN